ncbi:Cdc6/Cdc18 family protein [Cuniculiplasma divulgatum]|uniref:Orc1/Cdc6 family replication initiation protein n=1 Tax=Cuniculiplasma divulgatum TaxID=1673428 RepID=A0A1N5WEZ3_9ARCH|nr:Cdc6/Cdc18 family protein [Cuniculiplasma divulgatum]SIM83686.1 Orc1/Cdc6 family replication initiation protein [Cuniculiplasma divulgatum]
MSMKDPISFVEAKVKERAKETSNIKNAIIFDMDFKPPRILIRSELNKVTNDLADYVNLNLPRHIIIYGSKGSGKTLSALTIASAFRESKSMPFFYVNARENPTSTKIYRKMTRIDSRGHDIDEVKSRLDSMLSGKSIVILDEVDFLQDYDVLYHLSRHTKANLILLTQKVYWYKDMNDESVKSSMQPDHIVFHEYNADEIREILKMRAEEGLNKFDREALGLLSAMLVREYRSDARIGIKALEILGRINKWNDDAVKSALRQAYVEVEGETLRNLGGRDLLILASLIKNQDTNKAYSEVTNINNFLVKGMSKSTFFQSVNYLQNLGLVTLIKKKIGRYYTMESQILL